MGWEMVCETCGKYCCKFLLENTFWHFNFYIPVNTFIVCMFVYLLVYVSFSYGSILWTEY